MDPANMIYCRHDFMPACQPVSLQACNHAFRQACKPACLQTCISDCLRACKSASVHEYAPITTSTCLRSIAMETALVIAAAFRARKLQMLHAWCPRWFSTCTHPKILPELTIAELLVATRPLHTSHVGVHIAPRRTTTV